MSPEELVPGTEIIVPAGADPYRKAGYTARIVRSGELAPTAAGHVHLSLEVIRRDGTLIRRGTSRFGSRPVARSAWFDPANLIPLNRTNR